MQYQKNFTTFILVAVIISASCPVEGSDNDCANIGVVVKGGFLLSPKGEKFLRTSYIPNGTVVCIEGEETINYYKILHEPPIKQDYYHIKTTLGKQGYLLKSFVKPLANFDGKYIFPRTEILIYKQQFDLNTAKIQTIKDLVNRYNQGELAEDVILKLSSTYPKYEEPLKVAGITENYEFYLVSAKFLGDGVIGYVDIEDVLQRRAVVVDTNKITFLKTEWVSRFEKFRSFVSKIVKNEKLLEKIETAISNITDSMMLCRSSLELDAKGSLGADLWWVELSITVENKVELKPKYRDYEYSSIEISKGSDVSDTIEVMKYIRCDDDRMLFPVLIKIKILTEDKSDIIEAPRENFSKLSSYRAENDIVIGDQYKTILTIKNYNQWLELYKHLCQTLSTNVPNQQYVFPLLIDILIDSIAYYPQSSYGR